MKRLLFFISFFILCGIAKAQKVQVEEHLDSIEIALGDQCHLFLSVTANEKAEVKFPDFSQQKMIAPGIEVVEQLRGDSVRNDDGTLRQTIVY